MTLQRTPYRKLAPSRGKKRSPWADWYHSPDWKRLKANRLKREPWCRFCWKKGKREPARVVDHIKAHKGDRQLFLDPRNLQSLCFNCHNSVKRRMEESRKEARGLDGWPV